MDALRRYDGLLSRLLFDRSFLARLRGGDWSEFGEEAGDFSSLDLDQCEELSLAIRDGLVKGSLGGLGIGQAFPETSNAIAGTVCDAVEQFLADHAVVPPFDGTCRQAGVSVFESFYRWAESQLIRRPDALRMAQHEFAAALLTVLARKPTPGFHIQWPLVRSLKRGWFCVLDASRPLYSLWDPPDQPVAYVAALGQLVTGADAADFAAIALERTGSPPPWAIRQINELETSAIDELKGVLASLND